ncbi:MerC domain-containing protein [Olivibacter sp. SDN3]|uniref:MerC domain-containing protein n=1 Tax=Olivibacter sp. SDN3 TaxID=2764720 RepID=UPI0016511703|nr:MerC domain-containing protein [Olivibacter sp. SDN3]QNL47980.1 MerC domain-containing protein [Olivibacter sp. SDN3]
MKASLLGKMDRVGFTASALCAVHCALMPFIITLLPLIGLEFLSSAWFEIGIIALSIAIGLSSLIPSYLKYHRKTMPITLLVIGFVLIFGAHLLGFHEWEPVLVPMGGFTIAGAHFLNWKYNKPFHCDDCRRDVEEEQK